MAALMASLDFSSQQALKSCTSEELEEFFHSLHNSRQRRQSTKPSGVIATTEFKTQRKPFKVTKPKLLASRKDNGGLSKVKRPLNSWMAFRSYYSPIFVTLQQKEISGLVTKLWQADPFKAKWSILAKAYSVIRDHKANGAMTRLDAYLSLCGPLMEIVMPDRYLSTLGWVIADGVNGKDIVRTNNPSFNTSSNLSATDIISHCHQNGYINDEDMANIQNPTLRFSQSATLSMASRPTALESAYEMDFNGTGIASSPIDQHMAHTGTFSAFADAHIADANKDYVAMSDLLLGTSQVDYSQYTDDTQFQSAIYPDELDFNNPFNDGIGSEHGYWGVMHAIIMHDNGIPMDAATSSFDLPALIADLPSGVPHADNVSKEITDMAISPANATVDIDAARNTMDALKAVDLDAGRRPLDLQNALMGAIGSTFPHDEMFKPADSGPINLHWGPWTNKWRSYDVQTYDVEKYDIMKYDPSEYDHLVNWEWFQRNPYWFFNRNPHAFWVLRHYRQLGSPLLPERYFNLWRQAGIIGKSAGMVAGVL